MLIILALNFEIITLTCLHNSAVYLKDVKDADQLTVSVCYSQPKILQKITSCVLIWLSHRVY